ncbi:hypothetical protein C8Q78DRAFT_1006797 [Trametes maxima]|nr:hypothetical protein C8Q78DRAFT_1006797 [Trametes maxima]
MTRPPRQRFSYDWDRPTRAGSAGRRPGHLLELVVTKIGHDAHLDIRPINSLSPCRCRVCVARLRMSLEAPTRVRNSNRG